MKITKVDIYMLDATAQRASRRPICCRVWTDEGFYGDGEAGIAFDYAAPAGIGMLQDISRLVIGKDPMRTDELWERMFKVSFWGQGGGPVEEGQAAVPRGLLCQEKELAVAKGKEPGLLLHVQDGGLKEELASHQQGLLPHGFPVVGKALEEQPQQLLPPVLKGGVGLGEAL